MYGLLKYLKLVHCMTYYVCMAYFFHRNGTIYVLFHMHGLLDREEYVLWCFEWLFSACVIGEFRAYYHILLGALKILTKLC